MANFSYDKVKVFPSAKRLADKQRSARLMAEVNIVNIVNQLLDTDGFVISKSVDENLFKFNLGGYYFELTEAGVADAKSVGEPTGAVWAVLGSKTGDEYPELAADNSADEYMGVSFENAQSGVCLKILEKHEDGSWVIPEDSRVKIDINNIYYSDDSTSVSPSNWIIDCGEI